MWCTESECIPSIFPPQGFMPVLIGWNEIDTTQVEKCVQIAWILSLAWKKCCWKLFKRLSAGSKLTVSTDGASQPFPSWVVLHSHDIHSITLSHGQIQRPFAAPVVPHSCNVKHLRLSFQLESLRNGGRVELPAVWYVIFCAVWASSQKIRPRIDRLEDDVTELFPFQDPDCLSYELSCRRNKLTWNFFLNSFSCFCCSIRFLFCECWLFAPLL